MFEWAEQEAEYVLHRDLLVGLRRAISERAAVLRILDRADDAEVATSELMSLLDVDDVVARAVLNLRLEDFLKDRLRTLDEQIWNVVAAFGQDGD